MFYFCGAFAVGIISGSGITADQIFLAGPSFWLTKDADVTHFYPPHPFIDRTLLGGGGGGGGWRQGVSESNL